MNVVTTSTRNSLDDWLAGTPFASYTYSYPHKTAYRPLSPAVPLSDAWADEPRGALFLYLHVPFCEFRCGFCNLFTQTQPAHALPGQYLAQLQVEAQRVRESIPDANFARLAIGGGTPTFLDCRELANLFAIVTNVMGARPREIPVGCEASPTTVDREKLAHLRERGVDRISLGVQTFDDAESGRLGRPQKRADVERALAAIRDAGFPTLNIDLIYGGEGQTVESFRRSIDAALVHHPEEIYLYPLYVRPLTGLGARDRTWDDERLEQYRAGRDMLLEADYEQVSLRMFRAAYAREVNGPVYCCQEDGMVGLGCGARSYTERLHYSTVYAVGRSGVRAILADWLNREPASFASAGYGFRLDDEDRRRRYAILSLLQADGIDREAYARRFGTDLLDDLPELRQLDGAGLAEFTNGRIQLNARGLERSDVLGPWLYSARVNGLCAAYEAR